MKNKKKKKTVSDRGIVMRIDGNRVKLDGAKIKDVKLIPHWQVKTIEETVPIYDEKGVARNVITKATKESTVTFLPDMGIQKEEEISNKSFWDKLKEIFK